MTHNFNGVFHGYAEEKYGIKLGVADKYLFDLEVWNIQKKENIEIAAAIRKFLKLYGYIK